MKLLWTLLFALLTITSCKPRGGNSGSETRAAGSNGQKLVLPSAGSYDNDLDVDAVVKYMKMIRAKFYEGNHPGLSHINGHPNPGTPNQALTINEVIQCIGNNPPYWSTLVQHFYCLHPSYQNVIPNVRGCFSTLANANFVNGRGMYPEIFDYCMYQEYDAAQQKRPPFYAWELLQNRNADKRVGVLKYMTDEEIEVFKYVNFTWYNPFTYKVEHQQKVLDEFWGPGKYAVQTQGKALHPNSATIIPFMQAYEQNNHVVDFPNAIQTPSPTPSPSPPPPPAGITGTCGGVLHNNFCWYLAPQNAPSDCQTLCASHGGVHPATPWNFHQDPAGCQKTLTLFHASLPQASFNTAQCSSAYCGCIVNVGSSQGYLCTNGSPTSANNCHTDASWQRVCACNQ